MPVELSVCFVTISASLNLVSIRGGNQRFIFFSKRPAQLWCLLSVLFSLYLGFLPWGQISQCMKLIIQPHLELWLRVELYIYFPFTPLWCE